MCQHLFTQPHATVGDILQNIFPAVIAVAVRPSCANAAACCGYLLLLSAGITLLSVAQRRRGTTCCCDAVIPVFVACSTLLQYLFNIPIQCECDNMHCCVPLISVYQTYPVKNKAHKKFQLFLGE